MIYPIDISMEGKRKTKSKVMRGEQKQYGKERSPLPYRFSRGPLVMGGFRSSGTNTLGLRERHKYTLRQGPLDRREREREWKRRWRRRRELLESKSECSWADVLRGGRQRFGARPSTRTEERKAQMEKEGWE